MMRTLALLALLTLSTPAALTAHPGARAQRERLTRAIERSPTASLLLERARAARVAGELQRAQADLGRATKLAPRHPLLARERGLLRLALGQAARAIPDLTSHLELHPHDASVRLGRARASSGLGHHARSLRDYDVLRAQAPCVPVYLERGALLERMGRPDAALANYQEGVRAAAGAVVLRQELVRLALAQRAHGVAREALAPMLERRDIHRTPWLLRLGEVEAMAGRPKAAGRARADAVREAERAVARRRSPLLLMWRARAYLSIGRTQDARRDLREVRRRAPRMMEAANLLGSLEPGRRL